MPEHLRALVVILVLASVVFAFAKAPACALACLKGDFDRRRNLWIVLTLTAFLAHNFWIYMSIAAAVLLSALRSEQNKLAMFFFLLFALPPIPVKVPGFGLVNYLFEIDHLRLLALMVLLPAYLTLRRRADVEPFGRWVVDKLLAVYLLYSFVLMLEYSPFTSAIRNGVFYAFTDVFLPYYAASRCLRNLQDFRDALMAFAVAALVLGATLFFEFAWYWLLYQSLAQVLGEAWGWSPYQGRGGNLRASGPIGHAIGAGYVIAVAMGFFLYLRRVVPNSTVWGLGLLLLVAGLIAPLSRGPWVGAAVTLAVFVATGPAPVLVFTRLGLLGIFAVPLLLVSPVGEKIIDHLPFIGTLQADSVHFRQRLAEASFETFLENPLFGRYNYLETPVMEALRGWDGLIDMGNTYAAVGLRSGLVGLSLFVGLFVAVALSIYNGMRNLADRNDERYLLGRALISTLLGILVIIGTVSSVLVIPAIYWTVAGVGVAYARMLAPQKSPSAASSAGFRPTPIKRRA